MSDDRNARLEKLREAFPPEVVGKLPKVTCKACSERNCRDQTHTKKKCRECDAFITPAHIHIDFVGHAQTTDRLLSVDLEWTWEPMAFDEHGLPLLVRDANGNPVGLWIWMTVLGVRRPGYGSCESRKLEAVKELIGDAIRNAAMRFGVALDLWSKADLASSVEHDDRPAETPAPARSLPSPPPINASVTEVMSNAQSKAIFALLKQLKIDDAGRHTVAAEVLGRPVESFTSITFEEAGRLIEGLTSRVDAMKAGVK